MKKLTRVGKGERWIFGVCGGLSKYLNPELDPIIIRLFWLMASIFTLPFMLLLYIGLAIVLPREDKVITT